MQRPGAGPEIRDAVALAVFTGDIEAVAVVLHEQAMPVLVFVQANRDLRRLAVAQSVAYGLVGDLNQIGELRVVDVLRGVAVKLHVEPNRVIGAQVIQRCMQGGGKTLCVRSGRGVHQAADAGADVTDAGVEQVQTAVEQRDRIVGVVRELLAGGLEDEARGVERLDESVVEVPTEADLFFQRSVEVLVRQLCVRLRAGSHVAFASERRGLRDRRLGEVLEAVDLGPGGGKRRRRSG